MPDVITLDEAKLFLRIDDDAEDQTIEILIAAASESALSYSDGLDPDAAEYPARLKLAVLTHVAQAFSNRENGADAPPSTTRLMQHLRDFEV